MEKIKVKVKVIEGGKIPEFKTKGAVCADAYARLEATTTIPAGERALIPLGFACQPPEGYEIQVRPRSGLTSRGIDVEFDSEGIGIGLGTGDWDYTGEYKACVINNSKTDFVIENGDRICQIAVREAPAVEFETVKELKATERGDGGFGHTGIN